MLKCKQLLFIALITIILTGTYTTSIKSDGTNPIDKSINYYGNGYRYNIQGWVYLHLEGNPYEIGYQYGYLASKEIIDMMQRWSYFSSKDNYMKKIYPLKFNFKQYDWLAEKWWDICCDTSMKKFLKQVPEEYIQEMKGMADGLKDQRCKIFGREIEFEDVVASQFVQDVLYIKIYPHKKIGLIREIINRIKILSNFIDAPDDLHCNAFIATGDATNDGGILATHATIFDLYVSERCNFIVDIKPIKGNRFIMTCPPGSLWSQEDWYQNDKGLLLMETELYPQGPWKIRGTIPKGVRSRMAIQYSNSISDAIEILEEGNNGLIPNEWLIGDIRTGEIFSYQQVLYNTQKNHASDGYYWSCNFAHNLSVFSEQVFLPKIFIKLFVKLNLFQDIFPSEIEEDDLIWGQEIPLALMEFGEDNYGIINEINSKKFMMSSPINKNTSDCKITTSKLLRDSGLIAYFGQLNGTTWSHNDNEKDIFKGITNLPSSGWVTLYPFLSKPVLYPLKKLPNQDDFANNPNWEFEINSQRNFDFSNCEISGKLVICATSTGEIYALEKVNGLKKWVIKISEETINLVILKNNIIAGTDNAVFILDNESGNILHEINIEHISSKPIIIDNTLFIGCIDGSIHAFELFSWDYLWSYNFDEVIHFSAGDNGIIYISSGSKCYAFDINNQKILWFYETDGEIKSSPTYYDNKVFFGSWDGFLYALEADIGNELWKFESSWGIDTSPSISDNKVFFGSGDNNFYAININNGSLEWYNSCRSSFHSNSITFGDLVFFGCDDGWLYALNMTDGSLAWSFTPGYYLDYTTTHNYKTTPILSDPFINDEILYFGANGSIYALDAQTFESSEEERPPTSDYYLFILFASLVITVLLASIIIYLYKKKK